MSYYQQTPDGKNAQLWKLAQARASFRSHLATYLIMSVVFWSIWYFSGERTYNNSLPWPVWPMFGWGIGVAFHYIGAYVTPNSNAAEREYERLKENQK